MRKLKIEFIREEFKKENCTLLTVEYENNIQKLDYICSVGCKHSVKWNDWQQGQRCSCLEKHKYRPSIEFIRAEFAKEGYILLSTIYKGRHSKLDYICPRGHRHYISWHEWDINEGRCPYCLNKVKKDVNFICLEFKKEGYNLLTMCCRNAFQKLRYLCPRGHAHEITWGNWTTGYRCPYCAGQIKPSIAFIRSQFAKEGYTLLTNEYETNKTKLYYLCPKGHVHWLTWNKWTMNQRCRTCSYIERGINLSGSKSPNWNGGSSKESYCQEWTKELRESIKERDGYKCMNPYCNSKNPGDLTIHHIDYNKKNCGKKNLITACRSCNSGANTDRDWHEAWYKAVLYRRYNYKY